MFYINKYLSTLKNIHANDKPKSFKITYTLLIPKKQMCHKNIALEIFVTMVCKFIRNALVYI